MSTNILDSINSTLTPDLVGNAATALGESPVATGKAVGATVPVILGGLVRAASDGNLMSQIMNLLKSPANDGTVLRKPELILDTTTGRPSAMADLGNSFLSTLFGGRLRTVTDAIAQYAGVRSGSSGALLSMLAPVVLGVLGDRVKRDNLDVGGVTRLLVDQKDAIAAAMPAALSSVIGFSASPAETRRATAGAAGTAPKRSGFNWAWPLIGAAAIGAIWLFTRNGGGRMVDTAMGTLDTAASRAAAAASGAVASATDWVKHTLPGGVELNAPPEGIEHRLVRFVDDRNAAVNDTTWFEFDRLTFETGSATLRPESRDQLQNVASILRAYPNVHVKIGGYTDNTGNAGTNIRLSQDRADAVRRELEVLGISPTRLEAEGYGAQHPVAENTSEEGRAKNRRIALRVTQK
jgi:outer membrane protein OmpA-like peptidoglycan-associated protein